MRHFHELKDDCGFWTTCRDQPGLGDAKVEQTRSGVRDVRRVRRLVWGSQLEVGRSLENSLPLLGLWSSFLDRVLSVTGFVSQVSGGLSACEATFGKTGDETMFIFIFMGEELKPLQHIDHAHRNILEKHISSCFSCCERILVWKMKISCQRTFRARVFNSGSNNFLLICRRQSDNYVCWIQNDSFHNPFDALSGLHSPHKRSRRLFIVCLRPRQRWEIIQVWISRTTFPSCTFV